MNMIPDSRRPALPALTGIRFFAALGVVGVHFGTACLPWPLSLLATSGGQGVAFFFVLSGFILTYNYGAIPAALRGTRGAFYRARVARLYPIYALALLIAAPAAAGTPVPAYAQSPAWFAAAAPLLLVQAWLPYGGFSGNRPGWSLTCEAFFYAVFPFLLGPLVRLSPRRTLLVLAVCGALCAAIPAAYVALHLDAGSTRATPPWYALTYFTPIPRLPQFLLGMLVGRLYQLHPNPPRYAGSGTAVAAGAVLCTLLVLAHAPVIFQEGGATAPLFGVLILGLAWGRGALAAALAARPLVRLGGASYSLYLLHWSLYCYLARLVGSGQSSLPFFVWYTITASVAALAVFRWVEGPARRWLLARPAVSHAAPPAPAAGSAAFAAPAPG